MSVYIYYLYWLHSTMLWMYYYLYVQYSLVLIIILDSFKL